MEYYKLMKNVMMVIPKVETVAQKPAWRKRPPLILAMGLL